MSYSKVTPYTLGPTDKIKTLSSLWIKKTNRGDLLSSWQSFIKELFKKQETKASTIIYEQTPDEEEAFKKLIDRLISLIHNAHKENPHIAISGLIESKEEPTENKNISEFQEILVEILYQTCITPINTSSDTPSKNKIKINYENAFIITDALILWYDAQDSFFAPELHNIRTLLPQNPITDLIQLNNETKALITEMQWFSARKTVKTFLENLKSETNVINLLLSWLDEIKQKENPLQLLKEKAGIPTKSVDSLEIFLSELKNNLSIKAKDNPPSTPRRNIPEKEITTLTKIAIEIESAITPAETYLLRTHLCEAFLLHKITIENRKKEFFNSLSSEEIGTFTDWAAEKEPHEKLIDLLKNTTRINPNSATDSFEILKKQLQSKKKAPEAVQSPSYKQWENNSRRKLIKVINKIITQEQAIINAPLSLLSLSAQKTTAELLGKYYHPEEAISSFLQRKASLRFPSVEANIFFINLNNQLTREIETHNPIDTNTTIKSSFLEALITLAESTISSQIAISIGEDISLSNISAIASDPDETTHITSPTKLEQPLLPRAPQNISQPKKILTRVNREAERQRIKEEKANAERELPTLVAEEVPHPPELENIEQLIRVMPAEALLRLEKLFPYLSHHITKAILRHTHDFLEPSLTSLTYSSADGLPLTEEEPSFTHEKLYIYLTNLGNLKQTLLTNKKLTAAIQNLAANIKDITSTTRAMIIAQILTKHFLFPIHTLKTEEERQDLIRLLSFEFKEFTVPHLPNPDEPKKHNLCVALNINPSYQIYYKIISIIFEDKKGENLIPTSETFFTSTEPTRRIYQEEFTTTDSRGNQQIHLNPYHPYAMERFKDIGDKKISLQRKEITIPHSPFFPLEFKQTPPPYEFSKKLSDMCFENQRIPESGTEFVNEFNDILRNFSEKEKYTLILSWLMYCTKYPKHLSDPGIKTTITPPKIQKSHNDTQLFSNMPGHKNTSITRNYDITNEEDKTVRQIIATYTEKVQEDFATKILKLNFYQRMSYQAMPWLILAITLATIAGYATRVGLNPSAEAESEARTIEFEALDYSAYAIMAILGVLLANYVILPKYKGPCSRGRTTIINEELQAIAQERRSPHKPYLIAASALTTAAAISSGLVTWQYTLKLNNLEQIVADESDDISDDLYQQQINDFIKFDVVILTGIFLCSLLSGVAITIIAITDMIRDYTGDLSATKLFKKLLTGEFCHRQNRVQTSLYTPVLPNNNRFNSPSPVAKNSLPMHHQTPNNFEGVSYNPLLFTP